MDSAVFIPAAVYLAVINLTAFIVYGTDKKRAKRNKRRIPENTMIMLAALGGSLGALAAMGVFRHKTKKPKFYIGVPMILVFQLLLAGAVLFRCNVFVLSN